MAEKTIPLLPCQSTLLPAVVDFYTALGFTTTFRQDKPYAYAVVERGDVELQFFGLKGYEPESSYSGAYVLTDDVDALHAAFRAGLKAAYGRIPSRGLPRIGPLKDMSYGVRQFLVTDPTGNSLRIGQLTSEDQHHSPAPKERYARALHQAELYADSKEDLPGAAQIIDRALQWADGEGGTEAGPTPVQLLRLLVLRGDVAQRQGEAGLAEELLARAAGVPLTDDERAGARDALARLADLME
ncbi:bleomycin resistance protein [Streptomyces sp. NPDC003860]